MLCPQHRKPAHLVRCGSTWSLECRACHNPPASPPPAPSLRQLEASSALYPDGLAHLEIYRDKISTRAFLHEAGHMWHANVLFTSGQIDLLNTAGDAVGDAFWAAREFPGTWAHHVQTGRWATEAAEALAECFASVNLRGFPAETTETYGVPLNGPKMLDFFRNFPLSAPPGSSVTEPNPRGVLLGYEAGSSPGPMLSTLARYGFEVQAAVPYYPSAPDPAAAFVITVITVPIITFLKAFADRLGTKLADDAHTRFRDFVTELTQGRPAHVVDIRDPERRIRVLLPATLPETAYRQLLEIDISTTADDHVLQWDKDDLRWRSQPRNPSSTA